MIGHDGANGLTGCKKEISDINFVLIKCLRYGIAVLIDEFEIGNFMVFLFVLNSAIYQFEIDLCRLIYGKDFCWGQNVIKRNDNDG